MPFQVSLQGTIPIFGNIVSVPEEKQFFLPFQLPIYHIPFQVMEIFNNHFLYGFEYFSFLNYHQYNFHTAMLLEIFSFMSVNNDISSLRDLVKTIIFSHLKSIKHLNMLVMKLFLLN